MCSIKKLTSIIYLFLFTYIVYFIGLVEAKWEEGGMPEARKGESGVSVLGDVPMCLGG